MAGGTCTGETCENIFPNVTAIAFQTIMKLPQRPASSALVTETRLWFRCMASIAPLVGVVAAFACLMSLFDSDWPRRRVAAFLMTPDTAFTIVAVRALQPKEINVFVVVERHKAALIITTFKNEPRRLRNNRVAALRGAFFVEPGCKRACLAPQSVATSTARLTAPAFMTIETLSVIGALEIGLSKTYSQPGNFVALTASQHTARWIVVMAHRTAASHPRHFSVQFVREPYRRV
ncbi:MAG: hypothetical protein AABZ61_14720 [Bacteroidota bacterium]